MLVSEGGSIPDALDFNLSGADNQEVVGRERLKPKWVQVHMVEKLLMRRKD